MEFSLQKIVKEKIKEAEILREKRSLLFSIKKAEREKRVPIIGEIKKFSPTQKKRKNIDLKKVALEFEKGGICAISVLTDKHFEGTFDDLIEVKKTVKLPILRKDFIVTEFQIEQSRFLGADAILLISSLLLEKTKKMVKLAHKLGLEVLLEVHSERDLKFALATEAKLIGINNRNLKTLKTDISNSLKLISKIPKDKIVITESGIKKKEDLLKLLKAGARGALIGTSLSRAKNLSKKIKEYVFAR